MDDITSYFGCTYLYALKNIKPHIPHISINSVARKLIYRSHNEMYERWEEEILEHLVKKRILFNEEDFSNFIKSNVKKEVRYGHISLFDFEKVVGYQFILDHYDKNKETPSIILNKAAGKLYKQSKACIIPSMLDTIPEKLYSIKELKKYTGYRHDMEVLRLIKARGANKYLYGNLVRYDLSEIDTKSIPIPIDFYQKKDCDILMNEILDIAKVMLIMRKE
ncbi:hypothetical protein [Brevibacillus laterosporus]|uniref:hypothetical protein n=1 Tax=Brevibacillus laterosporus TaxID=1465 RepID=UPI003D22BEB6